MKKNRMLIVDSQQMVINQLKAQFPEYDVDEANNGRMALKMILEEKPDIILLDTTIPGIDGYTVLSIVKSSPETRFIPVILTAAIAGIEDQTKARERGADGFLVKPFNLMLLQSKIKNLLQIKALHDELSKAQQMLISLVQALEAKDEYAVGHSQRIAGYAVRLARKELLQPFWQEEIRTAALLHDIGKVGIKESIFQKPAKLTDEEYAIVKTHPAAGEKICAVLTNLAPVLPFIRHHHERFDGGGYPDGLIGTAIPLGARILAVADAYDALTSRRPYREAYSPDETVGILREHAGSQWDPQLVELFCQMVESGTLHSEEENKKT
ncbi:MAG: response regulator [Negativicutes bacterium]|nr:response regulator [Negativicutes bacterium]